MITIINNKEESYTCALVFRAFRRCCPLNGVECIPATDLPTQYAENGNIFVFISPRGESEVILRELMGKRNQKLIVFGKLPRFCIEHFDLDTSQSINMDEIIKLDPAPQDTHSKSKGSIQYLNGVFDVDDGPWSRPLARFDYANEWNNLGFGNFGEFGSPFGVGGFVKCSIENELAYIAYNEQPVCTFICQFEDEFGSLLFVNRPVGNSDSHDWKIVEDYVANFGDGRLPWLPILRDIPFGFNGALTVRLDCDEDITSANQLLELYKGYNVPLSLALTANLLTDDTHNQTLQKCIKDGGSILAHSLSHLPHWGGSYSSALNEAKKSKAVIEGCIQRPVENVVAPFHHTPDYSIKALNDAGFKACIGGISNAYPEFNLIRAGTYNDEIDVLCHCQQSMMHGHTIEQVGDPLSVFKEAMTISTKSGSWYGYLDHPFSNRYQYDWESEDARLDLHRTFIEHFQQQDGVLVAAEDECLAFLRSKANVMIDDDFEPSLQWFNKPPNGLVLGFEALGRVERVKIV